MSCKQRVYIYITCRTGACWRAAKGVRPSEVQSSSPQLANEFSTRRLVSSLCTHTGKKCLRMINTVSLACLCVFVCLWSEAQSQGIQMYGHAIALY